MKRIFFVFFLGTAILLSVAAQERNIALMPVVLDGTALPEALKPVLQQKLLQAVTAGGYGSDAGDFILTANLAAVEKSAVPTVPPQVSLKLELSLYVVNVPEKIIVDEYSVMTAGVDKNETAAYSRALRAFNPRDYRVKNFMEGVRTKIVDYYAGRVPVLIAKADSYAGRAEYDMAMSTLSVIPEAVPEYPKVAELMSRYYIMAIDREAEVLMAEAKAKLALDRTDEALELLASVDPLSSHFSEAGNRISDIESSLKEEKRRQAEKEMELFREKQELAERARQDEVMLEKMRLEASYSRSEAKAEIAGDVKKEISKWLFNELKLFRK
ncbi:MAG: hypothetical protein ACI3Z7_01050 [Candidatus Aphodosoma sp.]